MRSYPTVLQQLTKARLEQVPLVEVRLVAVAALDDDAADAAWLQQQLVQRQVGQVREHVRSFDVVEQLDRVVQRAERAGRVEWIVRERIGWQCVVPHVAKRYRFGLA